MPRSIRSAAYAALLLVALAAYAQSRFEGSAVVRAADTEYVIPIVCDDASRPELGFSTEPARLTREAIGRSSGVNLRLRRWQNGPESVVTLDRYVAWIPTPASRGGILELVLAMSPASVVRDGIPVTMTYDMWAAGDRPPGIDGVHIEANCSARDPEAPTTRRLTGGD